MPSIIGLISAYTTRQTKNRVYRLQRVCALKASTTFLQYVLQKSFLIFHNFATFRSRCPFFDCLFIVIICPPLCGLCKRGGNQASHALFDNLQNKFAYIENLQYLCIWKPRRAVCKIFTRPGCIYFLRIVIRISYLQNDKIITNFFIFPNVKN